MPSDPPGLRHGHADLAEVRLHYVEAGEGPLVVLLHGFPEFWYAWHRQIPALAAAGFHVVAPDMRGYNLSGRPLPTEAYATDHLAGDIRDLIAERSAASGGSGTAAGLAGHDWGANVAWSTAARHPESVERLAILNVPHPRRMLQGLRTPRQLRKSWYVFMFQLPRVPEWAMRRGGYRMLRAAIEDGAAPGAVTPGDLERYLEAWDRPGALTAMVAYYRAAARHRRHLPVVTTPTLVIWGRHDRHLGAELAVPDRADVPGLRDVVWLDDATHWVMRDEAERVSTLLGEFFAGGGPGGPSPEGPGGPGGPSPEGPASL